MNPSSFRHAPATFVVLLASFIISPAALIHRWSFNETSGTNFVDSVGGATASLVVHPGGSGHALNGTAARLNGGTRSTADFINIPNHVFNGLTDTTIEIWAAPHAFLNWSRLLDMGAGDALPNPATDNFRLSWSVGLNGNQQRFGLRPYAASDSALVTPLDQVYHYAIVWSATGGPEGQALISWYRDGNFVTNQVVGTATIAAIANLPQKEIWLGRSPFPTDATANASYHEMRIYSHALTPAEIALNTLRGPDNDGPDGVDGLLHRWSFSEPSGSVLADSVGAAHGQIISPGGGGGTNLLADGQLRLFGGAKATSDYVELPGGLLDGLENVTVEVWATPVSAMNWSRIWDFGSGVDNANTWFLSFSRGTDLNLQRMELLPHTLDTALPTALDQQYHYVGIWSSGGPDGGGRMAWYRDGVLVGEVDTGASTVAAVNDAAFWLGRSSWPDETANAYFNELRLYNRALTPGEINYNRLNGPDNVTIPPVNTIADSATLNPGAKVLLDVLANDTGATANPASVEIVTPPASGTATVQPNGRILYAHNGSATTFDAFTYRAQNFAGDTSAVAAVSLTITDALRLAAPTLNMPPATPPASFAFVDAFPGLFFEDALAITTPPGRTNQLFVVERRGRISYVPDLNAATPQRLVFLDIVNQMSFDDTSQGERGLLGLAFHPGFQTNGYFYVFYTAPGGSPYFNRLSRFTADPVALTVNTNTQLRFFDVADSVFNHNGGDLHFGPDGYLYIATGDEGDQYNQRLNAQRIDRDLYSALLRIDVDKRPGNPEPNPSANTTTIYTDGGGLAYYSIPADNPYVGATTFLGAPVNAAAVRSEIFAVGFRHIWRFSIDQPTGDIWVGDVGQDWYEEVNIVTNGGNYGWAYYEGLSNARSLYPSQGTLPTTPPPGYDHAEPVYTYLHTSRPGGDSQYKGNSVTTGVVYRGNRIPELTGAFIFGDFVSSHVWALWRTNDSVHVQRIGGTTAAAAFGHDPGNGDVLVANYVMNRIERLVRVDGGDGIFPQTLSDTGAFADLTDLAPNPGMVSYDPIVPFWSDHAIKSRWFALPDLNDTMTPVTDGNWLFPPGMVWVKHFDLELVRGNPATAKRLETRFIVKTTNSIYGVSYAWNAAGTEAFLVPDSGTNFNLTITNGIETFVQQWGIPSRSECLACHTPAGGLALSFNTRQLNQVAPLNHWTANQLTTLDVGGYLDTPIPAPQTLPAFARADDAAVSLEHRVRSYLSVNCVQCHQPGGNAPSTWDARAWLTLDATTLLNGIPNNNGGNPDNKHIVPGDPAHSVMLQRIRANGFSRMPPLATTVIDEAATNLLHLWISTELTNRQTFVQWQLAIFGSTNSADALALADPDGDSANNYYEYLTQTSPTNAVPAPWTISIDEGTGTVGVSFQRLANLGFLVETSTDFSDWELWDVPENILWFSATSFPDLITGPLAGPNRYYRMRLVAP